MKVVASRGEPVVAGQCLPGDALVLGLILKHAQNLACRREGCWYQIKWPGQFDRIVLFCMCRDDGEKDADRGTEIRVDGHERQAYRLHPCDVTANGPWKTAEKDARAALRPEKLSGLSPLISTVHHSSPPRSPVAFTACTQNVQIESFNCQTCKKH